MFEKKYETPRFENTDVQATEVMTWRSNYSKLIDTLGSIGTEVVRRRTLETDQDIEPKRFVRGAVHEFIFPPQETEVATDNSRVINSSPGYGLQRQDITRTFDESQVTGKIQVRYDDADSRISFSVSDMLDKSVFPLEVLTAMEVLDTPVSSKS